MVEIGRKTKTGANTESVAKMQKRRGRRKKGEVVPYIIDMEKMKYVADFSNNKSSLELLWGILSKANDRDFGDEVTFANLVNYWLSKTNDKMIIEIQEQSLSEKDRVMLHFKKNKQGKNFGGDLWEYLAKELKIK